MFGSQASTLRALADSPEAIKASGISEERTLILDMLEEMMTGPDPLDGLRALDTVELIIANVRAGVHRREFDGVAPQPTAAHPPADGPEEPRR